MRKTEMFSVHTCAHQVKTVWTHASAKEKWKPELARTYLLAKLHMTREFINEFIGAAAICYVEHSVCLVQMA